MEPIAKVLASVSPGSTPRLRNVSALPTNRSKEPSALSILPDAVIRSLWQRMTNIYGHRWGSAYGADASTGAGATWAQGLCGLSAEQIGAGIERSIVSADPWPPTLSQFRALCLGIPSLAEVRVDMKRADSQRAPFTVLVWSELDSWWYARSDQDRADRMLRDAYEAARARVMRGSPLPEPLPEIAPSAEKPAVKPAPPEVAAAHLAKLAEILGESNDETTLDAA